jgi:hypothetical protein
LAFVVDHPYPDVLAFRVALPCLDVYPDDVTWLVPDEASIPEALVVPAPCDDASPVVPVLQSDPYRAALVLHAFQVVLVLGDVVIQVAQAVDVPLTAEVLARVRAVEALLHPDVRSTPVLPETGVPDSCSVVLPVWSGIAPGAASYEGAASCEAAAWRREGAAWPSHSAAVAAGYARSPILLAAAAAGRPTAAGPASLHAVPVAMAAIPPVLVAAEAAVAPTAHQVPSCVAAAAAAYAGQAATVSVAPTDEEDPAIQANLPDHLGNHLLDTLKEAEADNRIPAASASRHHAAEADSEC